MGDAWWVAWVVLGAELALLTFVGFWFSLRALRWSTAVTGLALVIAVASFGLTHSGPASSNLVDSFLRGADDVINALMHPTGHVPSSGVTDRWVLAVVLVIGYCMLEAWTVRRQAPELDLSEISGDAADGSKATAAAAGSAAPPGGRDDEQRRRLAAELRFRLTTMQVRAPAILPGGTRANELASIAEASGYSGGGLIGAVLRFTGLVWPHPRRLRVRAWVESPEASGAPEASRVPQAPQTLEGSEVTQVTVLLEDVKTGLPLATKTVAGRNSTETISMAAGYIARRVFAGNRLVPEWCYGLADGRDLGAMQLVRMQRVYASCAEDVASARDEQIKTLGEYTGSVRTAGVVRYEHAQLLALADKHLESLRLHAMDRELHHRFFRGRYRFAMAIEMLVNPSHLLPNKPETWDKLEQILRIFQRCGLMDKELPATGEHLTAEGCWQPVTSPDPGVPRMRVSKSLAIKLLKIAIKDLREVQTELGWWRVTWNTLFRRGERTVWRPHRRSRYRQTFRDGVWVAELLIAVRCKLHEHEADLDRHWYLKPDGMALRRRERMSIDRMLAKATRITSFIADDPAFIDAVLKDPHGEWWNALTAKKDAKRKKSPKTDKDTLTWPRSRSGKRSQDRARWWPGQKRTASWQAAYNTACVYAALADAALAAKTEAEQIMATAEIAAAAATDEEVLAAGGLAEQALAEEIRATATNPEEVIVAEVLADEAWAAESQAVALAGMAVRARRHGAQAERQKAAASERMTELAEALPELERRIIASLRRAVENPSSELERPSDWIDTDPDFRFMCQYEKEFADFKQFRDDLKQQDYPLPPAECPVHAGAASAPAAQEGQHAVVSPMECPSPTWAMTRDQENHAPVLMTKKEPPAVTSPHHGTGLL